PDPGTARRVARFGAALEHDTQHFAKQLASKEASARAPGKSGPVPYCVQKYDVQPSSAKLEDRFIFDLLLYGEVRDDFVWKTLHGGEQYFVPRTAADTVLGQIDAGKQAVFVHSDLGNGKTLTLDILKCKAAAAQYAVYTVAKQGD